MNKKYKIVTPSGIHSGTCTIGEGETPKAAWEDAYGPKPWSPYVKKIAKNAWVEEATNDE